MLPTFPLPRCSFRFPNSLAKSCLHTLCSLSPYLCPAFKKLCSNKQGPVTGTSSARNVVRLEQSRICAGWLHSYMIYHTTKMECLAEQTFDKQLEHCCDQRSSILVGRVGIPSVTLTPAAPCSLTFVVGLLEWGSISDYNKLSNFILVSVQGHSRICLDWTTCCQMLALVADLEVIVKNKVLFWSPLPWPVLLENLLQARLFARYTPADFKATHSTSHKNGVELCTLQVETAGTSAWSCPWNCTRLLQWKSHYLDWHLIQRNR